MQLESEPGQRAETQAAVGSPPEPRQPVRAVVPEGQPTAASTPPARRGLFGRVWPFALLLILLGSCIWLVFNRDLALDWIALRGYKAPANIQQLANDSSMTAYGRRLFYVNDPRVENREAFNASCASTQHSEVSVLGCFVGDRRGIFIYNITEPQLNGIQQVTAAHEMLHQAYERLSSKDRRHIDGQLQAYANTITDPDLLAKIDTYKKHEPRQLLNEYHSIFGTEVRKLPPDLEAYYSRYFTDRGKVVDLYEKYRAAFTERTNQIAAYDAQLESLKRQIDADKSEIRRQESALKTRRAQLDALLAGDNTSQYNAAVPGFNAQVEIYKAQIAAANERIRTYNQIIDARNKIAVEEQQLYRAIDSQAAPASEQ